MTNKHRVFKAAGGWKYQCGVDGCTHDTVALPDRQWALNALELHVMAAHLISRGPRGGWVYRCSVAGCDSPTPEFDTPVLAVEALRRHKAVHGLFELMRERTPDGLEGGV